MKTLGKVLLGILTALPIGYMVFFMTFISMQVYNGNLNDAASEKMFHLIFLMHLGVMLILAVLLVIYIVDVFKNPNVSQEKKSLWAIVLFIGGPVAMPIYFYLYFVKHPKALAVSSVPGKGSDPIPS